MILFTCVRVRCMVQREKVGGGGETHRDIQRQGARLNHVPRIGNSSSRSQLRCIARHVAEGETLHCIYQKGQIANANEELVIRIPVTAGQPSTGSASSSELPARRERRAHPRVLEKKEP